MNTRALARAAAVVAVLGIVSRLLGFVREAVLSRTFGTSGAGGAQADAFVNGLFLVNTTAAVLLYALVTIVIPAFEQERQDRDESSAWQVIWVIGTWVVLGLCALGVLIAIFPQAPTALFGLDTERAALMEHLVRIMAPGLALQGISGLLTAVLQSQRRFAGPAAVGIAFNLGIVIAILIGDRSVEAAAWGVVAGATGQILFQFPQLIGVLRGVPGRPGFHHPRLAPIAALSVPVIGGSLLQQINGYTDKLFANSLEAGRTAALNYANAAGSAPRTLLLVPLLAPLFPVISRMVAERRDAETVSAFNRAAGVLALVSVPMGVFLAIYASEIAQILFGGSKCDAGCVSDIAGPLRFYAIATWGSFLGYLLNRSLSAANRARELLIATTVSVVITVALDLALLGPMEQSGLALATAIGVYVNTVINAWYLRRQFRVLSLVRLADRQLRLVACGLLAGGFALALNTAVASDERSTALTIGLITAKGVAAGVVYLALVRLTCPEEFREGRRAFAAIFRRARPA